MPVSTTATTGFAKSGALDYGHPTAILLWRPPNDTENWMKR